MKVLIMGLGLHGGGLETARYLLRHGAEITITDLRDEQTLAPSIEQLQMILKGEVSPSLQPASGKPDTGLPLPPQQGSAPQRPASIRYVLGRHELEDFQKADIVIKNPAVRPDSPYLLASRRIETDISLFLTAIGENNPAIRLTAVTGSKGKSSVVSALHHVFNLENKLIPGKAYLGGNITISPLAFLDELHKGDDVVLELSSWQLGDLRGRTNGRAGALLKPKAAVLTEILPDHMDRYNLMEDYVADKRVIYQGQDSNDLTIVKNDSWGNYFLSESKGCPLIYSLCPLPEGVSGGWIDDPAGPGCARLYGAMAQSAAAYGADFAEGELFEIVPADILVPGRHHKQNLLAAGLTLLGLGLNPEAVRKGLATFPGVEHRMELFHQANGIKFFNDSAATIPEAAAAAIEALGSSRLILAAGGSDKNLDFTPLVQAARHVKAVILLDGSASKKIGALLDDAGVKYLGPFDLLDNAVSAAINAASPGDTVVLSPGCASFGMFLNEFDRGNKWKETVRRISC